MVEKLTIHAWLTGFYFLRLAWIKNHRNGSHCLLYFARTPIKHRNIEKLIPTTIRTRVFKCKRKLDVHPIQTGIPDQLDLNLLF